MNVNIHTPGDLVKNLGMIPIFGSMPAESAVKLATQRLKDFDIDMEKDIVGSTADGASVMTKFGKLIPPLHVSCYVHAYHLAVVQFVYAKDDIEYEQEEPDEEEGAEVDVDEEWDEDDGGEVDEDDPENYENFRDILKKVRTAVKFFRKSPTKSEKYLQKLVEEQEGHMLMLILDVKTRYAHSFKTAGHADFD